jgi:hypothetical protein
MTLLRIVSIPAGIVLGTLVGYAGLWLAFSHIFPVTENTGAFFSSGAS